MKISEFIKYAKAIVEVKVDGVFTERLLNLCKTNNIKIFEVEQLAMGSLKLKMSPKEYKKMKKYVRKTKCKVKIVGKKGMYFNLFKYRKRRIFIYMLLLVLVGVYVFSMFIWKINVYGNENIQTQDIINALNEYGVRIGTSSNSIEKFKTADFIRAKMYEIAWVGLDISGTTLNVQVIEKVIPNEDNNKEIIGNIICTTDCVINKIIVEKGTTKYKIGDACKAGDVVVEGKIIYASGEETPVHAMGMVYGIVPYVFEKEYNYIEEVKINTNKTRYGIGIQLKDKEYVVKYLPKTQKCDISKKSYDINIFGLELKLLFNKYSIYEQSIQNYTYEELLEIARADMLKYEETLLVDGSQIISKTKQIETVDNKIVYKVFYDVAQNVGVFQAIGE